MRAGMAAICGHVWPRFIDGLMDRRENQPPEVSYLPTKPRLNKGATARGGVVAAGLLASHRRRHAQRQDHEICARA